jgi:hypothetical protein
MTNHNHHNRQPQTNPEHEVAFENVSSMVKRLEDALSEGGNQPLGNWTNTETGVDGGGALFDLASTLSENPDYVPDEYEQILLDYMDGVVDKTERYAALDKVTLLQRNSDPEADGDLTKIIANHAHETSNDYANQIDNLPQSLETIKQKGEVDGSTDEEITEKVEDHKRFIHTLEGRQEQVSRFTEAVQDNGLEVNQPVSVANEFMAAAQALKAEKAKPAGEQDPEVQANYDNALTELRNRSDLNRAEASVYRHLRSKDNSKYANKNYSVPKQAARQSTSTGTQTRTQTRTQTGTRRGGAPTPAQAGLRLRTVIPAPSGAGARTRVPAGAGVGGGSGRGPVPPVTGGPNNGNTNSPLGPDAGTGGPDTPEQAPGIADRVPDNEQGWELYLANCTSRVARIGAEMAMSPINHGVYTRAMEHAMAERDFALSNYADYKIGDILTNPNLSVEVRAAYINSFYMEHSVRASEQMITAEAETAAGKSIDAVHKRRRIIKAGMFAAGLVLSGGIGGAITGLAIGIGVTAAAKRAKDKRGSYMDTFTGAKRKLSDGTEAYVNDESLHAIENAMKSAEFDENDSDEEKLKKMKIAAFKAASEKISYQFDKGIQNERKKGLIKSAGYGALRGAVAYAGGHMAGDFLHYQFTGGGGSIRHFLSSMDSSTGAIGYTPSAAPWWYGLLGHM